MLGFRPLEWRCTSRQQHDGVFRQILGRGVWVRQDIRLNEDIRLSSLPLRFSIIGGEGTDRRFGRLQYSPTLSDDILNEPAQLHLELLVTAEDFNDLWSRCPARIPHLILFEIDGLRNERTWDLDMAEHAPLLISAYAFENVTIEEDSSKAPSIGTDMSLEALRQTVEMIGYKIDFIGKVSIAAVASIITLSILVLGFGQTGIVVSMVASATWMVVFGALKSTFPGKGK